MRGSFPVKSAGGVYAIAAYAVLIGGCQNQQTNRTEAPTSVAIWADPEDEDISGAQIRDVNNDPDRYALIAGDGRVIFSIGRVCNDCDTDFDTAQIDLGDGLVDIRFGEGITGDNVRRPFLVDAPSGNFIELTSTDSVVSFVVTEEPFEEEDDPDDDRAVFVETEPIDAGGTSSPAAGLCGIFGGPAAIVLLFSTMLVVPRVLRRWV